MRREVGTYSRIVQWAKITLPILALGLFSSVFLISQEDVFEGTGIVFSEADLSSLSKGIQIQTPRFAGVTDSGDKFLLTARAANPDGAKATRVEMSEVAATLDLSNGESVDVTAQRGLLNIMGQELDLTDGITIATSEGFRGKLRAAIADLQRGTLRSDHPVEVIGPMGQITSGGLKLETMFDDDGKTVQNHVLRFTSKVRVIFHPLPVTQD